MTFWGRGGSLVVSRDLEVVGSILTTHDMNLASLQQLLDS